jgi:flagellar motor protein MotB
MLGCQKSQPYLLGSTPSYLRPYNPGAAPAAMGTNTLATGAVPSGSAASSTGSALAGPALPGPALGLPSPPGMTSADPNSFTYAAQISELDRRARLLDENNRQLHSQLAQAQQQVQTYRERSDLMQQQLGDMSSQLQQARLAATRTAGPSVSPPSLAQNPQRTTANSSVMPPSMVSPSNVPGAGPSTDPLRRSGARLTANTSRALDSSSALGIEPLRSLGYPVETNGTSLRVRIPADQLFQPSSSQWTASAETLLERISNAIKAAAPGGQVLIDSYTDNSNPSIDGTTSTQQLTSQQADAILRYLVARGGWDTGSVTVRSNGSDLPLVDNQTASGRATNRRIEFIITESR